MQSSLEWWHEELGRGEHLALFATNRIDFEVRPALTDEELRALGLALGDRPLCFHSRADRIDMGAKLTQNRGAENAWSLFISPESPYVFVSPSCSNIAARSK